MASFHAPWAGRVSPVKSKEDMLKFRVIISGNNCFNAQVNILADSFVLALNKAETLLQTYGNLTNETLRIVAISELP